MTKYTIEVEMTYRGEYEIETELGEDWAKEIAAERLIEEEIESGNEPDTSFSTYIEDEDEED